MAPDVQHRYNLPQGQRYDYEGKGLIYDNNGSAKETPFDSNPMNTLNRGMEQDQ